MWPSPVYHSCVTKLMNLFVIYNDRLLPATVIFSQYSGTPGLTICHISIRWTGISLQPNSRFNDIVRKFLKLSLYRDKADNFLFTARYLLILKSVIDHQINYKCNIQSILQCPIVITRNISRSVNDIPVVKPRISLYHFDLLGRVLGNIWVPYCGAELSGWPNRSSVCCFFDLDWWCSEVPPKESERDLFALDVT